MEKRAVEGIWKAVPTVEGAGVKLQRVFGQAQLPRLDPFLLLDDFSSTKTRDYLAGFPWHPHRGIETVTYILKGKVAHEDSIGNKGTIRDGEVQWMTAGSGIIHQEMPQKSPEMKGFQLWVNLPSARKMMDPRYQDVGKGEIPEVDYQGATVRVICGSLSGTRGPVQDIMVKPGYLDVEMGQEGTFDHAVPRGHKVFAYVVEGEGVFDRQKATAGELVLFSDGDHLSIKSGERLRFLLISGAPLNERIAWYGPIVMNTETELRKAFDEYSAGKFTKKNPL